MTCRKRVLLGLNPVQYDLKPNCFFYNDFIVMFAAAIINKYK